MENFANSGDDQLGESAETTLALSSVIELGGTRQARVAIVDAQAALSDWEQESVTLDVLSQLTTTFVDGLKI